MSASDEAVRADAILHDTARAKVFWEQAGRYSQEALDVAHQADFGTSLFRADMVAGMAALVQGDRKAAAEFARKAIDAPATEALQYPFRNARAWPMNWQFPTILAARLLRTVIVTWWWNCWSITRGSPSRTAIAGWRILP